MNYALNPKLLRWAYEFSKKRVPLQDSQALQAYRANYVGFPKAQRPPEVMIGGSLSTARYWHGEKRTEWARDWVRMWTNGQDHFSTTSMELADYVGTLQRMSAQGLVDFRRVMMLRSASNYCMPPTGQAATSTIGDESVGTIPAF